MHNEQFNDVFRSGGGGTEEIKRKKSVWLRISGINSYMATLFALKLYWVVWLELPSFVTLGFPCPSALIVPKVKLSYILSILCTSSDLLPLGHSGDLKAYLE